MKKIRVSTIRERIYIRFITVSGSERATLERLHVFVQARDVFSIVSENARDADESEVVRFPAAPRKWFLQNGSRTLSDFEIVRHQPKIIVKGNRFSFYSIKIFENIELISTQHLTESIHTCV